MSQVPGRMAPPPGHVVSSPSWGPEPVIPYRMVAIVCAAAMLLLRACCPAADAFPLRFGQPDNQTDNPAVGQLGRQVAPNQPFTQPFTTTSHHKMGLGKTNSLQTSTPSHRGGGGIGQKPMASRPQPPTHRGGVGGLKPLAYRPLGQSQWPAHPNPQPTGGVGGV